jgi:hypothetical protein
VINNRFDNSGPCPFATKLVAKMLFARTCCLVWCKSGLSTIHFHPRQGTPKWISGSTGARISKKCAQIVFDPDIRISAFLSPLFQFVRGYSGEVLSTAHQVANFEWSVRIYGAFRGLFRGEDECLGPAKTENNRLWCERMYIGVTQGGR